MSRLLYAKTKKLVFSKESKMEEHLRLVDDSTLVIPPPSQRTLMLNEDGTTKTGYRYTSIALNAVAKVAAPGLSLLLPNIAGTYKRAGHLDDAVSMREAVRIFNIVVDLRFSGCLADCQLVVNERTKTIEGFLGPKTTYLDNLSMFGLSRDATLGVHASAEFCQGILAGRRMLVRYILSDSIASVDSPEGPDNHHQGYHFSNSEEGQTSVYAAAMIYRKRDGTASLAEPKEIGYRQAHTGRDFSQKLNQLMAGALTMELHMEKYTGAMEKLKATSLELDPRDLNNLDDREESIARRVCRMHSHLTKSRASAIAHRAIYIGGYPKKTNRVFKVERDKDIAARSEYDLYQAITAEGRDLPIRKKEIVESMAYVFLASRLEI